MKNALCPTIVNIFQPKNKQKNDGCKNMGKCVAKKIISQRHNNSVFYALCKGHLFCFICPFFPNFFVCLFVSWSFFHSSFGARFFPFRLRLWLLLMNCYFYDFMLTRTRDSIVINVQSSWISCSSMKFLSIWFFMTSHGWDAHTHTQSFIRNRNEFVIAFWIVLVFVLLLLLFYRCYDAITVVSVVGWIFPAFSLSLSFIQAKAPTLSHHNKKPNKIVMWTKAALVTTPFCPYTLWFQSI